MASCGIAYMRYAPFAALTPDESASAYPRYGAPINVGGAAKMTDTENQVEASNYGDNILKQYAKITKTVDIDVEVTDLQSSDAVVIYGGEVDSSTHEVKYPKSAPFGGMAVVTHCKDDDNVDYWRAYYYPKVVATRSGKDFETEGENIAFKNDKIKFKAFRPACDCEPCVPSEEFDTEAGAIDWVDDMIVAYTAPVNGQ